MNDGNDKFLRSMKHKRPRPSATEQLPSESDSDLRDGGDLRLFPPDFPSDREAQILWSATRRQILADAMRRQAGDEALFRISRVAVSGEAAHFPAGHDHTGDSFARGTERLGALGYSLLRGQLLIAQHLEIRLELLEGAYEDLIAGVIGAREEGLQRADWLFRERARLIFWDGIGLLHQVSEQLASLFDARRRWLDGEGDLGDLLIRSEIAGWKVIASPAFGSPRTWRKVLGIPPNPKAVAKLTAEQRELLADLQKRTEVLVLANIRSLRQVWTRDLHRAATRYKHSYPVLSGTHGLVWLGEDPATRARVGRLVRNGALLIADHDPASGSTEELVIPVTIGGIEVLFDAIRAAMRVASMLVFSVLNLGENPSGRTVVFHPVARASVPASDEQVLGLLTAYTGSSDIFASLEPISKQAASRAQIEAASRRVRARNT